MSSPTMGRPSRKPSSRVCDSILMTSAPMSANSWAAIGEAKAVPKSSTRYPAKASAGTLISILSDYPCLPQQEQLLVRHSQAPAIDRLIVLPQTRRRATDRPWGFTQAIGGAGIGQGACIVSRNGDEVLAIAQMGILDDIFERTHGPGRDAMRLRLREDCLLGPRHEPGSHEGINFLRVLLGDVPAVAVTWIVHPGWAAHELQQAVPLGQLWAGDTHEAILTL